MQRRKFLQGAGIAGILASGTAPAIVMAQQNIRWRLASSFPKSLDTIYGAAEEMSKAISELSEGKFQIDVFAAGELVPAFGVFDAVQQGTVEMAHTASYYYVGKNDALAFDCAVPFGLNARMINAWMYDAGGLQLMRELFARYDIVNFPLGNTGAQWGGWYRKEIKSVKDFNGLKMRIGGFGGRVLAKLGAVPQNIPAGEIYQSLEKGTIDAAEWIGPYDDLRLGLHKVAKHYYFPAWWEGSTQFSVYINSKQWNSLPAEYKAIVEQAARAAHVTCQARYDSRNPGSLKQLIAEGAKLSRFPKDFMDAAFKASREVYAELNQKNANWKKIYADYSRFLGDQVRWEAVAESNYSQYLAAQKL